MASLPNRGVTAYAQQLQLQLQATDPWYQSLEIARSKVQAALTPGAFGHGVPELNNLSTNDILMTFGLSVLGGIAVFMAIKALLPYKDKEKISNRNKSVINHSQNLNGSTEKFRIITMGHSMAVKLDRANQRAFVVVFVLIDMSSNQKPTHT